MDAKTEKQRVDVTKSNRKNNSKNKSERGNNRKMRG
jgi:hypothetical protein